MNVPNNIRFRMDMDSEHELVEHVDGDDEADSLWEIEESLELTETCPTENVTVTATTCYEKDVDIEELLCDTPEPTNPESTTEDSVEDLTNGLGTKELQNILLIEEKKTLAKISEMEINKEMLSELKEKIRTGLRLILENLKNTKSNFDKVETLTWETSKIPVQIGKWEKECLEQEYELWREICKTLENRRKWEEYKKIFEDCWEDFEEEDLEIIEECERLGVHMETQRVKIFKTGEKYFRKAGMNI